MTTDTIERPVETAEHYDRETGNIVFRNEIPHAVTPTKLAEPGALASPTCGEIFAALALAQGELSNVTKDTDGQSGNQTYKYATLAAVLDTIREPFLKHGLALVQRVTPADGGVLLQTLITHASGEWISDGGLFLPVDRNDAKAYGSAITYARRYAATAMLGIAQEDDDGTQAVNATSGASRPTAAGNSAPASSGGGGRQLRTWRWGDEKGTALGDVSEKSLRWLVGQTKFGSDNDRACAQAELDRRQAQKGPQSSPAGEGAPGTGEAAGAADAPAEQPMRADTKATLVQLLIEAGLAPDEEAADDLIADRGDGSDAWGVRQINLIRGRMAASRGETPDGEA